MRRQWLSLILLAFCFVTGSAEAAYRSFEGAAGVSPSKTVDKTQLEGWITKVEYKQNTFRLMDPRGFERTVTLKPGWINDYRLGDHVKVSIDRDFPWTTLVEKL